MRCPKCGEKNPESAFQCQECGERFDAGATSTQLNLYESQGRKTAGPLNDAPTELPPRRSTASSGVSQSGPSHPNGPIREPTPFTLFGDRYEILELLGEGGMGRVHKARDRELDKLVALKTIRAEMGDDPSILQRFKQELVLARQITHKNVIRIFDLGEAEGVKFFTMEYIEGESLKNLLHERGRLPAEQALPLARQVLGALQEAHNQGVIHRDLKPQNIMIDRDGAAHVMDFGIARLAGDTGMTASGEILGSPDYMSPEQVRGERADAQSDLFCFGVILYEVLTGDLPYKADTTAAKVMMRLTQRPRPPRELDSGIPKYLESIVLKCMEADRALRYKNVAQVLEDMDREKVDAALTLRMQRAVARRKAGVAAAVVMLVSVGAGAYLATRDRSPSSRVSETAPVATLAILPFTNAGGSSEFEWMRTGLPEMLVTDISQSRHVRPVSGDRVFKLLHQLGIAEQTRFDETAIESISRMAPAQLVLYGQFVESGGKLRLDMTLRKAGSGVPLPLKVEAASSNVFALVDEITGRIKEQLDLTPDQLKGDNDRPIAEVFTASLEALRAYQAGLAQFQRGANKAAIPLLKEATIKDPNFAMAYARLAEAHRNIGESHEAEAAIDRAQRLSEKAVLPLTERYQIHATAALVKDDFETAAKSYGEMAKLYPEDPDIQLNLAGSLEKLGKLPEAIESYKRVMKIAPGYGAALLGLGRVEVMSGHHNEAISSLQGALATGQHRDDLEGMGMIHSILGIAYREIGNLEKAREHLNLSLDFRTKAADKRGQAATLSTLATVYALMGQNDKALDAHTRALTIAREMGDRDRESNYLVEIGVTHKTAGDLDRALDAFRQSLQIEMGRQDYTHLSNRMDHIADIYRLKGQFDDALAYLEQAKTYLAKSGEKTEKANNFTYIGLVWKAQGQYKEALEALRAALALFHEMGQQLAVGEVHQYLAEIYINQGRYADSYKSLQQSLDIYTKLQVNHGIPEVKTPLARLLIILGLPDEAERELGEAGHHAGGGHSEGLAPGILLGRAELARLRGKYELASKAYQQAAIQANRNGQKEASLESRVKLANLYLEQGKLGDAERLLLSTRQEASQSRLRSLESEAAAGLSVAYLAKGQSEPARKAALEAIKIAEKFSGAPILYRAYASLGGALVRLNRLSEATDAYSKAASTLDWIRGSLLPEHVDSFMGRPDIVTFLRKTVAALEEGGRNAEALPLKKWITPAHASQGEAVARGPR